MLAGLMITLLSTTATLQDPADILRTMHTRQQARWETVRNYTVVQRFQGNRMSQVPLYHERIEVDGEITFRMVPEAEWSRGTTGLSRAQSDSIATGMAFGLGAIGDVHQQEIGGPMGAYIKDMTTDMATFLHATRDFDEEETTRDATAAVRMAAEFRRRASTAGRETAGGREAYVVRADGLEDVRMEQPANGPRFTLHSVTMWVDAEHYVPLRLAMEGRVEGSDSPVIIELREERYRAFGPLFEPTVRTMRLSGLMEAMATDPRQKRDLQRAREEARKSQAEMARMEEQLAKMPAAQRRMIEGQMERARAQLEMIANEGVFEVEVQLEIIGVNKGPPIGWRPSD
jgi:hypothetical protein